MAEFSPMMQRYLETKEEYKDCILFYRLGDFYEMFFDDAITASRELELTLTGKDCGQEERAPMCGIPHHAAEIYISKLISKGYKVAICEQLEDPKKAKGIVKRGVIRVVTPGTLVESNMLEERKNNFIMSIFKSGIYYGISVCDISTGEFYSAEIKDNYNFPMLLDEIARYTPSELLVNSMMSNCQEEIGKIKERFENIYITNFNDKFFTSELNNINLKFNIVDNNGKKVENIQDKTLAVSSINALVEYIEETQKTTLDHINKITVYQLSKYMALDINARRNLEITEKMRDKSKKGTLLWVLDKTSTSMGGRLLRRWLNDPLIDVKEINKRLSAVKELKDSIMLRGDVIENLKKVYDIERLAGKMAFGNANARDMITLKNSLYKLPDVKNILKGCKSDYLMELYERLDELQDIHVLIENSIVDDPPMTIKEGGIIKLGYDEEIDKLKTAQTEGKNWLIQLEAEEKEKTGIKNLKVGFNKVFGYYLEVTKSFLEKVPDRYIRKQTLTNAERYITEELKTLENQILSAEERVVNLEYEAFTKIRGKIAKNVRRLQTTSEVISTLDVLASFAQVAEDMNYCMPEINDTGIIDIKNGRHPVVEVVSKLEYVPNDCELDNGVNTLLITGPNMSGKSTFMRQLAIIVIMAQMGSFVPCESATLPIIDKIFTRIGASDDLVSGESTFMVEMKEARNAIHNATANSLILFDELGRGTATYDGMSLAQAILEYISDNIKSFTLFSTHYHELTRLDKKYKNIKNVHVSAVENGNEITFLHKVKNGAVDKSYGIHVARLAKMPDSLLKRADEILNEYESNAKKKNPEEKIQLTMDFETNVKKDDIIKETIENIDVLNTTPMEALNVLFDLKQKIKKGE